MIASMLAESVAVAGTPMPATATVTSLVAAARRPSKAVRSMFRSSYEPPKDPAHDVLYEELKTKQMLEKLSDALTAIRLKAPLWMKFAGCEGISNAWYEAYDGAITFCYEYVAELEQGARDAPAHGIPADLAPDGALVFVFLQETRPGASWHAELRMVSPDLPDLAGSPDLREDEKRPLAAPSAWCA